MRRSILKLAGCIGIGLIAGLTMLPHEAHAWWKDDWSFRKKLTIDTSASGAGISDPIGTTAVLIRLHVGNFKFESAKDDGSDLRFIAGDDKTPLQYHVEKYDSLLGEAFVWVNMPDLKPGAQTDIYLYYGNQKATSGEDAKATYDPDTVLVYHFNEHNLPLQDSTAWANNTQGAAPTADGSLIGSGLRLDGQNTVALPASPSLTWTDNAAMTWSAWVKPAALQANAVIFSRHDGVNALLIGMDNGIPFVQVTNAAGTQRSAAAAPVAAGSWHHLAVVGAAQQMTLFLDGAPYATLNAGVPALNSAAVIGADSVAAPAPAATPTSGTAPATPAATATPGAAPAPTTPDATAAAAAAAAPSMAPFTGEMDELEIAKVARPLGFIKAAVISQGGDEGKFLHLGDDEETASWLSGYFAVILRSVTLDGWVVIGILAIMAAISWVVMVDKTVYIGRQAKANTKFLQSFRHVAADLTVLDRGDADEISSMGGHVKASDLRMMRNSSLYRIYHIGAEEIRHRFTGNEQHRIISPQSVAAIRASLDTGLIREMQKLNRLMVFLTIAISGGPFLGLLGTVVGVMITFAAIAASGDVNVNAIAPGIAAALVATVAGLAVAIPALFGYNYLITRIKDSTSDMQVFADELVTKIAEFYSERREQQYRAAE